MAIEQITNYSDFTGDMLGETGLVATTNQVETTLITGITATKSVDKTNWITGPLEYTIVINNNSGEDFTNVVFTDNLDALITLDETYGVFVNDVETEDYTFVSNLLTIPIGTVADGTSTTIKFHVLQA